MGLPEPRHGEAESLHIFPETSEEVTIGDPEKVVWSSIKQMTARDLAEHVLYNVHNVTSKLRRKVTAENIKLYIAQAFEFYEAARIAKANTAPLFYYYSFLNLAKSLCEIRYPMFHKRPESRRHGLSWQPSPKYFVEMKNEYLTISTRGVWHTLLDAVEGQRQTIANPTKIKIKYLFALCPEIAIEFARTYGESSKLIRLVEPQILYDQGKHKIWIRIAINRDDLKENKISRFALLRLISEGATRYHQVQNNDSENWAFEFETPKDIPARHRGLFCRLLTQEIGKLNLFTFLLQDGLVYHIPIQTRLPIRLCQSVVIYTLLFWLGSLVRYDPHSVAALQDSQYWLLIDGFMNQSRVWLLELFEWELYRTERTLNSVR
jgi:hypothetical protein